MRINLAGLGSGPGVDIAPSSLPSSTPQCGSTPCSWIDDIYVRDACVEYMRCVAPNSNVAIDAAAKETADAMSVGDVAQGAGQVAGGITSEVANVVGRFLGGAAGGATSSMSLSGFLLLGAVALVAITVIPAVLQRR